MVAPEDPGASRRAPPRQTASSRGGRVSPSRTSSRGVGPADRAPGPDQPGSIEVSLAGPITRADLPLLCASARTLLGSGGVDRLICDVGAIADPDVTAVDALARLQLTALRLGGRVCLANPSAELRDLLDLVGLTAVLGLSPPSRIEARRQAEEREVRLGVEEERHAADPTA